MDSLDKEILRVISESFHTQLPVNFDKLNGEEMRTWLVGGDIVTSELPDATVW